MLSKLTVWKQKIILFAGALGAPGLFLISFLDSSVLSFPIINDLLLIDLSINRPARMPLYAAAASLGSVLGCVLLYYIARKGGEAFFHKNAGVHGHSVRHWVEQNGFAGMLVAALLPPPRRTIWPQRFAVSGPAQAASSHCRDCFCRRQLSAIAMDPSSSPGRCATAVKRRVLVSKGLRPLCC